MDLYDDPVQMEPLVVHDTRPRHAELIGLAYELSEASACLDAALCAPTAQSLATLVTGMNCYYSNLIEGQHTLPLEIAKALQDAKGAPSQKDLPSLASAHVSADIWARSAPLNESSLLPAIQEIHRIFCSQLPPEMLVLKDGTVMIPGAIRQREVSVGRHVAPRAEALGLFLDRFSQFYGQRLACSARGGSSKLDGIVSAFAAHHRLAWIHPFPDGNGRVARIVLDAMLRQCGVNGAALWSMSRGFAKSNVMYKQQMALADSPRQGDLDGRGNLSEKCLADYCAYALQTGLDQARFMASMFDLNAFKGRVEAYFQRVRFDLKPESAFLYLQAFAMGEVERMSAGRLTGLKERTARDVVSQLTAEGFLVSDTPKGKLRVGFPVHALGSLLPNLYPAGDVDFLPPLAAMG